MVSNPAKTLARAAKFGTYPMDPNHHTISGDGNYFMTIDATGTPQTSPLTVSTSAFPVTVPAAAFRMTIISSAVLLVSEDPLMASAIQIPANTPFVLPVASPGNDPATANVGLIYLKNAATVYFMFSCI